MKVVEFAGYGDPARVVDCVETAEPGMPTGDEVLVEVLAAPINPADVLILEGRYPGPENLPAGGGIEVDGEHGRGLGGARGTLRLRVPQHLDGLDLHRRDRRAPSVMGAPATFAHFSNFVWYRSQKVVACRCRCLRNPPNAATLPLAPAPLLARATVTRR